MVTLLVLLLLLLYCYLLAADTATCCLLLLLCCCCSYQYRNPWGFVRIGRILEDLDSLAGTIAFSHW
jgi:hypothetical protein